MIKFLSLTKNNKASILPVTVIATFIMMIIAYACIKMFMAQNIMVTQDQIKARVTYAAAGIAEKQIARLKAAIDAKIIQDPTVEITADTVLDATGIKNLQKNGENYDFIFADVLNQTVAQDPDVVSDQDFFTSKGVYGANTGTVPENEVMFPRIKCSTFTINTHSLPSNVCIDGGIAFYKERGVTVSNISYFSYNSNDYKEINNTVYPNNGDDRDPRNIEIERIRTEGRGDETFVNCDASAWYCSYFVSFLPDPYWWDGDIANNLVESKIALRFIPPSGGVLTSTVRSICNAYANEKYPVQQEIYLGKKLSLLYWIEQNSFVKNSKQSYVITAVAKSPAISNKIPEITSEVRIYFDLFMTKFCKKSRYGSESSGTVGNYSSKRVESTNPCNGVSSWNFGASASTQKTRFPSVVITVLPDPHKIISNIKFHIQKWEVVS